MQWVAVKLPIVFSSPSQNSQYESCFFGKECVFLSCTKRRYIMDSFGDYIYLIILVVAGLSGLFRKKKQPDNMNPTPAAPKRSWEDVLRNLVPVEEEQKVEPKYEKPILPKKKQSVPQPAMNYDKTEGSTGLRATKQVSQLVSHQRVLVDEIKDEEPKSFLQDIQLHSLEDAKRAFIYSEIFNRKY